MNARSLTGVVETGPGPALSPCSACAAYAQGLCHIAAAAGLGSVAQFAPNSIQQSGHSAPARRIICRERDLDDVVPVICSGWAASVVTLSDGRRQILSFLLPGDTVSMALVFGGRAHCLVESITEVRYRIFRRIDLKRALFERPELMERLGNAWFKEKTRADQLIVDLGRRTANERIARLLLNLVERLAARAMAHGDPVEVEFPLRQYHIADAVGLTSVHTSKVLSEFRRAGLVAIDERSLTILDPQRLRGVAQAR